MTIIGRFVRQYWLSSLLAVVGVTLTIASYFIADVKVDIKYLIGLFIVLFSFMLAEGKMIWDLARDKKLLTIDRKPKKFHAGENALVLRRSEEVSINSLVGIYEVLDGKMERIVAIGEVYNQTDKMSQVRILRIELQEEQRPMLAVNLFADEKLARYRIKPHIPAEFFRNSPAQGETHV